MWALTLGKSSTAVRRWVPCDRPKQSALNIIEMASAAYRVTYKTGPHTGREGEGEIVRRENNATHGGIRVSGHGRDESANRRVH